MVKQVVRDVFFLGQKSEPATKDDIPIGQTLKLSGWEAQICQHELDHLQGIII